MSDPLRLPGDPSCPAGVSVRDIKGAQECPHQHEDGADAFECVAYQIDPEGDGTDRAVFECDLCGERQEREART